MGPKDQDQKLSTPSEHFLVTHRLLGQQGQDYLEGYYVCAEVCVRTRVPEGNAKSGKTHGLCVSNGEGD